jgi:hypothetical protein
MTVWEEVEFRRRVWLVVAATVGVLAAFPYLVAYVLPSVALGYGLGLLFYKGCCPSFYERMFGNVALYIPASAILTLIVLAVFDPKPSLEPGILSTYLMAPAPRSDGWRDAFSHLYHFWYGYIPIVNWFVDCASRPSYCYAHFYWTVMIGVCLLAPAYFWVLQMSDVADRDDRRNETDRRQREHYTSQLQDASEDYEKRRAKLVAAIEARDLEIDRLKLREKYLRKGKPQVVTGTPDKPDLGYL